MHKEIYERLQSIAKAGRVITYSEIAPLAGLDMSQIDDRNRIAEILGDISTFEFKHGRPLLSVVVIHRDNNIPGQGFFTLARNLGVYNDYDDLLFFIQELRRVHDYWREHS